MDMEIPRNFELRIFHDSEKPEPNTVHCTVLPLDRSFVASWAKRRSISKPFFTIWNTLSGFQIPVSSGSWMTTSNPGGPGPDLRQLPRSCVTRDFLPEIDGGSEHGGPMRKRGPDYLGPLEWERICRADR